VIADEEGGNVGKSFLLIADDEVTMQPTTLFKKPLENKLI
jgi:hypothetical protein